MVTTRASADLRAQIDVFRAMLREVREQGLTFEGQDAVARLAVFIRTLLDETTLP
jgi:hypothetical protein